MGCGTLERGWWRVVRLFFIRTTPWGGMAQEMACPQKRTANEEDAPPKKAVPNFTKDITAPECGSSSSGFAFLGLVLVLELEW